MAAAARRCPPAAPSGRPGPAATHRPLPTRALARPRRLRAVAARAGAPDDSHGREDDAINAEWRDLLAHLGRSGSPPPAPGSPPPYSPAADGTRLPTDGPPPPLGAWAWPPAPASAHGGAVDDTWDWGDGEGYTPFGAAAAAAAASSPSGPPSLGEGWRLGGAGSDAAAAAAPATPAAAASAPAAAALAPGATVAPGSSWAACSTVYVILFGVGCAETEGIYSLRAARADDGLPHDTIVAFERASDAARYAGRLHAAMAHAPVVCGIAPAELLDFCADANYAARLEPAGSLLAPPECNVGLTDWERSVRLRGGQWSVLPSDPVVGGGDGEGGAADGCAGAPAPPASLPHSPQNNAGATSQGLAASLSPLELDAARARLERAWAVEQPEGEE